MKKQPSTSIQTLRIFISTWFKTPWLFAGSLLLGPAYALLNIITPLFIAKIIGQLATAQTVDSHYIWLAAGTLLSGIILSYAGHYVWEIPLNLRGISHMHRTALQHIMQQEYNFFANTFGGALVTKARQMAKSFETFTYTVFVETIGLLTGVLISFVIMIYYHPLIGLTVFSLWIVAITLVIYLCVKRIPIRRRAVAKSTQMTGELADIMTNIITIKTFARETTEQSRYQTTDQERSDLMWYSWRVAANNALVINILCGALQLVVLIGGIWSIQNGTLSIAMFLLFQVYILRVIDSILQAVHVVRQFEGVFGDSYEMTELFARTPTIQDPVKPQRSRISEGAINMQNIQFSYNTAQVDKLDDHRLLKDFTLYIKPGEKVGLVGPSGGGKSTITKLLLRFADVQSGAILIDNQDIRDIKQDDLHNAISFVPQEPLLFHRSIAENIGYGNPRASKKDIIRVSEQAHAHEFIKDLPKGYDTLVGERGIKLSGGQRQRVAIARAMLKQSPILILDEATSALDSESEHYIQQSLWKLMEGKTAIVIAHRLSTIQRMDRIVVLDQGTIVESGTHTELLTKNGMYAKLWSHQSGGFLNEETET